MDSYEVGIINELTKFIKQTEDHVKFYDHLFLDNSNSRWLLEYESQLVPVLKQKALETNNPNIKSYIEQYLFLKDAPLNSYLSHEYYNNGITNLDVILSRNYRGLLDNFYKKKTDPYLLYIMDLEKIKNTPLTKIAFNVMKNTTIYYNYGYKLEEYQKAFYDYLYNNSVSKVSDEKDTLFKLLPSDVKGIIIIEDLKEEIYKDINILIYLFKEKEASYICNEDAIKRLFDNNSTLGLWYSLWLGYQNNDKDMQNRLVDYFINRPDKPSLHISYLNEEVDEKLIISIFLLPMLKKDYQMVEKLLNYYPEEINTISEFHKDDNDEEYDEYVKKYSGLIFVKEVIDFINHHDIANRYADILPATFAIFINDTYLYKLLVNGHDCVKLSSETSQSILQWAVAAGNYEIVRDLLSRGCNANERGGDYKETDYYLPNIPNITASGYGVAHAIPPLAIAAGLFDSKTDKISSLYMVKLLMEHGADVNAAIFDQGKGFGIVYEPNTGEFTSETDYSDDNDDSDKTSTYVSRVQGNTDIYNYLISKGGHE